MLRLERPHGKRVMNAQQQDCRKNIQIRQPSVPWSTCSSELSRLTTNFSSLRGTRFGHLGVSIPGGRVGCDAALVCLSAQLFGLPSCFVLTLPVSPCASGPPEWRGRLGYSSGPLLVWSNYCDDGLADGGLAPVRCHLVYLVWLRVQLRGKMLRSFAGGSCGQ